MVHRSKGKTKLLEEIIKKIFMTLHWQKILRYDIKGLIHKKEIAKLGFTKLKTFAL